MTSLNRDKPTSEQPAKTQASTRPSKLLDSLIDDQLQKAFAYGWEMGTLNVAYKISLPSYEPNAEIEAIKALLTTELLASSRKAKHSPEPNQHRKPTAWKTTLTIGRFTWTTKHPELLPELQIIAPTEPKMEYQLKARKKEIAELNLDLPKRWRFRLKNHNDKTKEAWYDFYAQE